MTNLSAIARLNHHSARVHSELGRLLACSNGGFFSMITGRLPDRHMRTEIIAASEFNRAIARRAADVAFNDCEADEGRTQYFSLIQQIKDHTALVTIVSA